MRGSSPCVDVPRPPSFGWRNPRRPLKPRVCGSNPGCSVQPSREMRQSKRCSTVRRGLKRLPSATRTTRDASVGSRRRRRRPRRPPPPPPDRAHGLPRRAGGGRTRRPREGRSGLRPRHPRDGDRRDANAATGRGLPDGERRPRRGRGGRSRTRLSVLLRPVRPLAGALQRYHQPRLPPRRR